MSAAGRVLIYGGKGALGSTCVQFFKGKKWWVASVDMLENDQADANVVVDVESGWNDQTVRIATGIEEALQGQKLDAVLCVAGGWAGGNAAAKDFIQISELSWKQSVWTSAAAAHIATKFLKEGGVLTLTGAKAALEGTPGMIGYGMAKAAVHHLTTSLAQPKSGLPNSAVVVSILPVTLDTPMNRKWMPKADTTTWTPLEFVAGLLFKWSSGEDLPSSGSLVQLITKDNQTDLITV